MNALNAPGDARKAYQKALDAAKKSDWRETERLLRKSPRAVSQLCGRVGGTGADGDRCRPTNRGEGVVPPVDRTRSEVRERNCG